MSSASPAALRVGAVFGALAALFNFLGVLPLAELPAAYKPGRLPEWLGQIQDHPTETAQSALLFTLGVLCLVPFAAALRRAWPESGLIDAGSRLIATGGLMNGAATLAPFVVSHQLQPLMDPRTPPAALALLGLTLSMDALFNGLLGIGIGLIGVAWLLQGRRALGGYSLIAGLATAPVALQAVSEPFARWLAVALPLWLGWLVLASVVLARGVAASAPPTASR